MKYHVLFIIVFILLICLYMININTVTTIIQPSHIHNQGLFANTYFKKGDIIIPNLFPMKPEHIEFYDDVSLDMFSKSIINEGKYVNHCNKSYNSNILTNDFHTFPLIATKNIKKNTEITANYNHIHKHIPFIAGSKKHFKKC
jgi:hypothetical protein